jgi:hypothetical protein
VRAGPRQRDGVRIAAQPQAYDGSPVSSPTLRQPDFRTYARPFVGPHHQPALRYLPAYEAESSWRRRQRGNPDAFRDTVLALLRAEPLSLDVLTARKQAPHANATSRGRGTGNGSQAPSLTEDGLRGSEQHAAHCRRVPPLAASRGGEFWAGVRTLSRRWATPWRASGGRG